MNRILIPPRRFDENKPEMVDRPDADPVLLRGELRNLRIINRLFGGHRAVQKALLSLIGEGEYEGTLQILDLATGSGDQAVAMARKFRRLGKKVSITAVDNNEVILAIAREYTSAFDEITIVKGDIRALAYPDRSFDIVLCSLAIHHFSWSAAVRLLQEMDRMSRLGFIVSDLSRSYIALATAWLYTHLTTTNIMTKTDAIASIFAAFTDEELRRMAYDAGGGAIEITKVPFFRLNAVRRKKR